MRVLIVEDNTSKLENIKNCLKKTYVDIELIERYSFNSGLKEILSSAFDYIILDMSLPTYDITRNENGGDKRRLGGLNILKRMYMKKIFIPVIVITQFESFDNGTLSLSSLNEELSARYSSIWKGTVYYGNNDWEEQLKQLVDSFMEDIDEYTHC